MFILMQNAFNILFLRMHYVCMLTKTVDDNFKSQAQNISVVNYFLSPKRDLGNPVLVVMQHCQVSCVPCLAGLWSPS